MSLVVLHNIHMQPQIDVTMNVFSWQRYKHHFYISTLYVSHVACLFTMYTIVIELYNAKWA